MMFSLIGEHRKLSYHFNCLIPYCQESNRVGVSDVQQLVGLSYL
jgi:hypothetical protein